MDITGAEKDKSSRHDKRQKRDIGYSLDQMTAEDFTTDQSLFNYSSQLSAPSVQKKTIQKMESPEEEELQMKKGPVQKMSSPEEEELQMKKGPVQKSTAPEEEELQMKSAPLQKQALPEEDELQMKQTPTQKMAAPEEDELQMKKNPVQKKSTNGSGMPADVQMKMESSFGTDFSGVNIHVNDDSATQMGALAYTKGNDVHFAPGQYNPQSQSGQELLGHELTHVVQQRQGRVQATTQQKGVGVNDDPALEKEADDMGKKASTGLPSMNPTTGNQVTSFALQKKAPWEEVRDFQAGTYEKKNYVPATGRGLFDVKLNPLSGRLEIKVNVGFSFKDGSAARFSGLADQNEKWTDAEKLKWKKEFIKQIEGQWGGRNHFINQKLPNVTVFVDVEVEEVAKDWHYELNVTKIPKGEFQGSSITHYLDASTKKALPKVNNHYGTLDSEDLTWADKGAAEKQKGAVHEFGHMVGLGDEYKDSSPGITHATLVQDALGKKISEGTTNDIMSSGHTIGKQHYITFLDALKTVTNRNDWEFKK